ncbi:MAG: hypothetical protein NTV54_13645 [Ignavibacteriales bacterium]|nr:hypothetical protein [Ignavibacteriales bacterium]
MIATELDTLSNYQRDPKNPFREQRLARSYPHQDESWNRSPGTVDTDKFVTDYRAMVKSECGTFTNVYAFKLEPSFLRDTIYLAPHYAPGIGFIGADINNDGVLDVSVAYAKVGGREYGKLWPVKWSMNRSQNIQSMHRLTGLQ